MDMVVYKLGHGGLKCGTWWFIMWDMVVYKVGHSGL